MAVSLTVVSFLKSPAAATAPCSWKAVVPGKKLLVSSSSSSSNYSFASDDSFDRIAGSGRVSACFLDPTQQPILKEALQEPVAFVGGIFAGLLRLDLNEDPLKEWVAKTVEASGIIEEEISNTDVQEEEMPQQIEIE